MIEERNKLLDKHNANSGGDINRSENQSYMTGAVKPDGQNGPGLSQSPEQNKKRNYLIGGVVAFVLALIIILIILLSKGSSDNPKPGPNPPVPPPIPHNFTNGSSNPYVIDPSSQVNGEYIYHGVITIPTHQKE